MTTEAKPSTLQIIKDYFTGDLSLTFPIQDDDQVPPASIIARAKGIGKVRSVAEKIGVLRTLGLLPPPKPENTRRRATVSGSLSRGGKWLELERYSFMSPEEADFALGEKLGEEKKSEMGLDKASIRRLLTKHTVAGHIKRTDEERESIFLTIHESKEVKRGRAIFWVRLANLLDQQGIKSPDNRVIWVDIWRRAENVNNGVRLVVERLAQGQRLHSVVQQILETQAVTSSLSAHLRNNFVADEKDKKVFKEFRGTIDRVDSMSLTLAEKEKLFRCLFWENKGGEEYSKFFMVPSDKLRKDLGNLIDEVEQLRLMYGSLWPDEKD